MKMGVSLRETETETETERHRDWVAGTPLPAHDGVFPKHVHVVFLLYFLPQIWRGKT